MKFERNKKEKRIFLYGLICVVVLTLTITFITSKAKYRISASYPLANDTVKSNPYDFNIISMYISDDSKNYNETTTMPTGSYVINEDNSYCYIGSKDNIDNEAKLYTNSNGEHIISNLIKGDKCILYFDKTFTMEELLATYYTDKRVRESGTFNQTISGETSRVIYSAPDDYGTSYYFAGNPTDNWVLFGGYYWRIIRVNGDKSIRMIYQGTEPNLAGENTGIGNGEFNKLEKDENSNIISINEYVGYWYTHGLSHGYNISSFAYNRLNDWFNNSNIKQGTKYYNKIEINAGFCNDRGPSTNPTNLNGLGGTGAVTTYYAAYIRLITQKNPTLKCNNNYDLFTVRNTNDGNQVLENPVGLITADEIAYAGLVAHSGSDLPSTINGNYLCVKDYYLTMTPSDFDATWTYVSSIFVVDNFCGFRNGAVHYSTAGNLRPVVNLRSDVTFTGNGTASNPYKVVTA